MLTGWRCEYCVEPEPLGTGGAIRFAAERMDRTFLALNGDSLREVDLSLLLAFHRERRAKATILLTRVSDPTRYGLVRVDGEGKVCGFLEKPSPEEIDTDLINAGLYVLEPEVLELMPLGKALSIERDVFPRLAEEGLSSRSTCPATGSMLGRAKATSRHTSTFCRAMRQS